METNFRSLKNLLIISTGYLLLFSANYGLTNLLSTINSKDGIGLISQSVLYGVFIVSSLLLPKAVIRKFGCKWTLVFAILLYAPYSAANISSQEATLMFTAALTGLGAGPLWASKATYVTQVARQYAIEVNQPQDVVVSRFFGIFFTFFQSSQIWGNLISFHVLKPSKETELYALNVSLSVCGIRFCGESHVTNPNLQPPSEPQLHMLIGIYLACDVLAALIVAILLDPLESNDAVRDENYTLCDGLFATLKNSKNPAQALLIILTMFTGLENAFFVGDFTSAYVACSWGIYHIGHVFLSFGATSIVGSFLSGFPPRYISRVAIFTIAFVANVVACIIMFLWTPNAEESGVFFVIAGIWGFSDAIWISQLHAFYGLLFVGEEEAAFGNFWLWSSLGSVICFAAIKFLCTSAKLYMLLGFLTIGIMGYFAVEIRTRKKEGDFELEKY